jgi:hypothetical protein
MQMLAMQGLLMQMLCASCIYKAVAAESTQVFVTYVREYLWPAVAL